MFISTTQSEPEMNVVENSHYDVVIVGAGPAGLFAAHELADIGLNILIVDMGKDIDQRSCNMSEMQYCKHCSPCDIMCGIGGAGTFSDGTLNLRPDIGGDLIEYTKNVQDAWELIDYVDSLFVNCGASNKVYMPNDSETEQLKKTAASVGARFIEVKQRHIGSDNSQKVISRFKKLLEQKRINFLLNTEVTDIFVENNICKGILTSNNNKITARYTLIAPGRIGGDWVNDLVEKHSIKAQYTGVDIGVRVEVPAIIMNPITKINRDPKFHIYTKKYDDFVRTFCTNEQGFVVKEEYEGFIATNGHSFHSKKSENTNFAFLVHIELTEPIENTIKYARSVAKLATTIGGGKPVLQRIGDLRRGRRSTAKRIDRNPVINTLSEVTPGDISMAMPHRIVMDIIEGLESLNKIIPGVASDSTLLYAPEVKFYSMKLCVNEQMETSIDNLFAAGDGTGLSRDIVNAAATGILAGRGILNYENPV
ncbi:NAD(P)/FAD-dependent oxidoreductase [Methanosalsum natronophilum]|nr:NAD(P)/FAD-dependent oxidoreductase [Methanosalsum natronophilum]